MAGFNTFSPTDIQVSSVGAAGTITATIAAVAGKTAYLSSLTITGTGATAATVVAATVAGPGVTLSFQIPVPVIATTIGIAPMVIPFSRPIPASGPNVAIVITLPSFGAGNTAVAIAATGFYE
jgi:hypothetical protein